MSKIQINVLPDGRKERPTIPVRNGDDEHVPRIAPMDTAKNPLFLPPPSNVVLGFEAHGLVDLDVFVFAADRDACVVDVSGADFADKIKPVHNGSLVDIEISGHG